MRGADREWVQIRLIHLLAALFVPGCLALLGAGKAEVEEQYTRGQVVIVGTGKDFLALRKEAKKLAQKAGVPFSLRGVVFDKKRGLHFEGDPWENDGYVFRRNSTTEISGKDSHFISIEKSDAYPGLKPGYYIIVADICFSEKEAAKVVARYRNYSPTAYAPSTRLYMGCMH